VRPERLARVLLVAATIAGSSVTSCSTSTPQLTAEREPAAAIALQDVVTTLYLDMGSDSPRIHPIRVVIAMPADFRIGWEGRAFRQWFLHTVQVIVRAEKAEYMPNAWTTPCQPKGPLLPREWEPTINLVRHENDLHGHQAICRGIPRPDHAARSDSPSWWSTRFEQVGEAMVICEATLTGLSGYGRISALGRAPRVWRPYLVPPEIGQAHAICGSMRVLEVGAPCTDCGTAGIDPLAPD
jgi:predicted secreted Zn-dependent protease